MATLIIPLWIKILPIIELTYAHKLQYVLNCSYQALLENIKEMENLGWITSKKENRTRMYKLTDLGNRIKVECEILLKYVDIESYFDSKHVDLKYIKKFLKDF